MDEKENNIETTQETTEPADDQPKPVLKPIPKNIFDIIRWIQITLMGLSTLYIALGSLWNLPAKEAVAGSLAAIATFLGIYLKADTAAWEKEIFK